MPTVTITDTLVCTRCQLTGYVIAGNLALPDETSREIREAILADLWNFKGDAEQADDLTLLVVKAPS